jgi:hypothetical protein
MFGVLSMLLVWGAGTPASAQENQWTKMNPGANAPGANSLHQQCLQSISRSGWSTADCASLRQLAADGACMHIMVPDGQWYLSLTGVTGVSGNITKFLGSDTAALECVVAPGKVAHWYTGYPGACNNLGIMQTQTMINTGVRIEREPPIVVHIPGYDNICGCDIDIPGLTIVVPGGDKEIYQFNYR